MINEKQKLENNKDSYEEFKAELSELRKSGRYEALKSIDKKDAGNIKNLNKEDGTYGFIAANTPYNIAVDPDYNVTINTDPVSSDYNKELKATKVNDYDERSFVWVNPSTVTLNNQEAALSPDATKVTSLDTPGVIWTKYPYRSDKIDPKTLTNEEIESITRYNKTLSENSYYASKNLVAVPEATEQPTKKNSLNDILKEEAQERFLKELNDIKSRLKEKIATVTAKKEEETEANIGTIKPEPIPLRLFSGYLDRSYVRVKHDELFRLLSNPRYRNLRIIVDQYNTVRIDSVLNALVKASGAVGLPSWFNILTEVLIHYKEGIDDFIKGGVLDLTSEVQYLTNLKEGVKVNKEGASRRSSASSDRGIFDKYYKAAEKSVKKTEEVVPIEESEEIIVNYIELADFLSERDLRIKYKDYTLEKYEQEYNELNAEYIKQIIKFKRNKNG